MDAAKLMAVVVFPTPPFWLATARTLVRISPAPVYHKRPFRLEQKRDVKKTDKNFDHFPRG
jgi:hypothetical protein